MDSTTVTDIATWAGPIITATGFVFVWIQLRGQRIALETQTGAHIYQLSLGIHRMFVDSPELRPFFYDGAPPPSEEPLRSKTHAAAELICDHLEHIVLSRGAMDEKTYRLWLVYIAKLHASSPLMREFLLKEGDRYDADFLRLCDEKASGVA